MKEIEKEIVRCIKYAMTQAKKNGTAFNWQKIFEDHSFSAMQNEMGLVMRALWAPMHTRSIFKAIEAYAKSNEFLAIEPEPIDDDCLRGFIEKKQAIESAYKNKCNSLHLEMQKELEMAHEKLLLDRAEKRAKEEKVKKLKQQIEQQIEDAGLSGSIFDFEFE